MLVGCRQHDAAVLSLLYAGQQLALSSSICKEDVQCLIGLLKLGSQLAEAASSPLLFHNLGGEGMLTTGCTRLLVRPCPVQTAGMHSFSCRHQ